MSGPSRAFKTRSRAEPPPLTPDQTAAWVRTYGRQSRVYAWGFFLLVLPAILGLIWWEMGELSQDVLSSFAFAALVFFLLARWSRRATTQSWLGVVEDVARNQMQVRRMRALRERYPSAGVPQRSLPGHGRKVTLRLPHELSGYFRPGDRVFKLSGFDWPEKVERDGPERVCQACGRLYPQGQGRCWRCSAPEPDHETLVRLAG